MVKSDDFPKTVYEVIRLSGLQRPRIHGFSKIHKRDVPCHPILSMIESAQHELAKFLAVLMQPVLELTNGINDFFSFAKMIQQHKINSNDSFLVDLIFIVCLLTYPQRIPLKFVLKHFMTITSSLQLLLNMVLLN